ncbi:MAG: ABC transporter permease, partial [Blastocatellia bacterium]
FRLIRFIGLIVPRRLRADWRQEWEAELRYRELLLAEWDKLKGKNKLDLLRRSIGACWDALLLQPQRWEDEMIQDLRFAVRMLVKNWSFTLIAVLSLGLGIGANTAIFSVANALFLRPFPTAQPDRLVRFHATEARSGKLDTFSYPNYADVRDRAASLAGLAAHQHVSVSLSAGNAAEPAYGELATGNYFAVLGINAAQGRSLMPADDESPGAHPVLVISHGLWQSRFGADPNIIGRKVRLNGHPFSVIGVMPEGFRGSYEAFSADFWAPMMMHEQVRPRATQLTRRGWGWLNGIGRLKPQVTLTQANAELHTLSQQLETEHPQFNRGTAFQFFPASAMPERLRAGASQALGFMMAIVSIVLLVACANIASILLSRVITRRRETAIRQALGAGRVRIARQWLTESLLLAGLGGGCGLLLAVLGKNALLSFAPPDLTNFAPTLSLDRRVLGFSLLVTLATGLLFGLFPAWRAGKADVNHTLKEEGALATGHAHRSRLFSVFVMTQIAASLLLLIVAGLLLRSLRESTLFDPGFKTENLLLATVDLRRHGYDQERGLEFYQQLSERLRTLPGARAVTLALTVPLSGSRDSLSYRIPGHTPPAGGTGFSISYNVVGASYFATLGIPLLQGRDFEPRDLQPTAKPVVVINETMARRFWPGENAVGRNIALDGGGPALEIIGVARDSKYVSLGEEPQPFIYGSFGQAYTPELTLHVRTLNHPEALLPAVRQTVAALDSNIALSNQMAFAEWRRVALFPIRTLGLFSAFFGALALALAMLGIYGVVSYAVTQRTREIGVRLALGAQRRDIFKLIVGRGMVLIGIGIGVGLAAALALTRLLSGVLFGISAADPLTFGVVLLLLAAVALLACYLPAQRATRVDPLAALRHD